MSKELSKTVVRQAMRHFFGLSYRQTNYFYGVRLENIWYSVNDNCAIKWYNRSKEEQDAAIFIAHSCIENVEGVYTPVMNTRLRKKIIYETLADLA